METAEMLVKFSGTGILCKRTDPDLPELRRFPLTLPFGNWLIVYTVPFNGIQILACFMVHKTGSVSSLSNTSRWHFAPN